MKIRFLFLTLLTLCLLNVVGYFPVFKLKQWLIHHQIEAIIEQTFSNEPLHLIAISSKNLNELKWARKGKEFWYKGQLFDIVRFEKKDGVTHYYCINDTAETHLVYQYVDNINTQTNDENSENTPLSNFFKKILKVYFPPHYAPDNPMVYMQTHKQNKIIVTYVNYYDSKFYNRIDPPPKRLV